MALREAAHPSHQKSHCRSLPQPGGAADVVVESHVAGFAYDDFKRAGELIRSGEVAMRKALPEVCQWLEMPAETLIPAKSRPVVATAPMPADWKSNNSHSRLPASVSQFARKLMWRQPP